MSHYSSLESLSLPRRQRVFDSPQLVPAGDALPIWKKMSLDTKLPVVPCPRGSYTLYTTNVGIPKYIHKQHYDFDLNDALCARPKEYDSLHDPSLKGYFRNPRTRKQLIHNDLITKDGKVKCNVKEFNEYRSYLRYRSVTELSLQRSGTRVEESWLGRPTKSETPRTKDSVSIATREYSERSVPGGFYGRDVSLVERLRMREKTLLQRMTEKQRQREREHDQRIRESWQSRKQRQQRLLKQEEEIDHKAREERARMVEQRERTLARQRERMMSKLNRKQRGGKRKKEYSGDEEEEEEKVREEEERKNDDSRKHSLAQEDKEHASDNA